LIVLITVEKSVPVEFDQKQIFSGGGGRARIEAIVIINYYSITWNKFLTQSGTAPLHCLLRLTEIFNNMIRD